MDKVVQKLAALGVPGLVVLAVAATTGLFGGAAMLAALAAMGGPFGIVGGFAAIALLALAVDAVAQWGFEALAKAVVAQIIKSGTSREKIRSTIEGYWMLSKGLRKTMLEHV